MKPTEHANVRLVISKVLTNKKDAEDITYDNIAEIVQLKNTVGRRDMDAVPGNQQPNEVPKEYDADFAERIVILDPFGENRNYTVYYVIGLIVLITAGGAVVYKEKC